MKIFANIILVLVYAISIFGIGIKQFYCCGKLKSTSISYVNSNFQKESKPKCGMGKCKRSCCKHKYHFYKLDNNHLASASLGAPEKQSPEVHAVFPVVQSGMVSHQQQTFANNSHAPPFHHGVPVYIFNCVYRI